MEPLTDVRAISRLAYGFMASKVLFAALNLDLFSRVSAQPKTLGELAEETGIAAKRWGAPDRGTADAGLRRTGSQRLPATARLHGRG